MNIITILSLVFFLTSCANQASKNTLEASEDKSVNKDTSYHWTEVLKDSPWKKSYNFQMFTIDDKLWVFHHDGSWSSTDGKNWSKSPLPNPINNLAFLKYIDFKGAVYGLGHLEGNIEQHTFKPEIYKTTDFKKWETIATKSNLPYRFFYVPFVFENKIWIIGGEDKDTQYADIWNSSDGVTWTKQKDHLPFGKRSNSQIESSSIRICFLERYIFSQIASIS